jgi:hypothetical protein
LQLGAHAFDGARAGVSPIAQVEHKPWISNRFSSESGWWRVILAEILNVAK